MISGFIGQVMLCLCCSPICKLCKHVWIHSNMICITYRLILKKLIRLPNYLHISCTFWFNQCSAYRRYIKWVIETKKMYWQQKIVSAVCWLYRLISNNLIRLPNYLHISCTLWFNQYSAYRRYIKWVIETEKYVLATKNSLSRFVYQSHHHPDTAITMRAKNNGLHIANISPCISWLLMSVCRSKFHFNLFLWLQLTISQH